jgi:hypothetical protein
MSVLRTDFARLGGEARLSRALCNLVDACVIVKLGVMVFPSRLASDYKAGRTTQMLLMQRDQ